jgi:hypothetical protein
MDVLFLLISWVLSVCLNATFGREREKNVGGSFVLTVTVRRVSGSLEISYASECL